MRALALRSLFFLFLMVVLALFFIGATAHGAQGECDKASAVSSAAANAIVVDSQGHKRKSIGPEYFGFNLVWSGFQRSHWDSAFKRVAPEITEWMSVFPGAVYRYGNVNSWRDTVGPVDGRPTRMIDSWAAPIAAKFGYDEYLDFVGQVKGQAWLIANISGKYEGELPIGFLANEAANWLLYSDAKHQAGSPAVLRWELGNELDRGKNPWSPEKYAGNALAIASAMTNTQLNPIFVGMFQDYDAIKGMTASQYNRRVVQLLSPGVREFEQHLYYDGPPGGTPIPNRLAQLCRSIEDVYSVRPDITPSFWITEHARWPPGDDKPDWAKNWWRSVNLEGALGVADMMIAATQVPEVRGVFLHSMEGTASPWPLFHRMPDQRLQASAVYHALSILRTTLLDDVLVTQTASRWDSDYFGRYDLRATVLANTSRTKYALWAVNRHQSSISSSLKIPALAGKRLKTQVSVLADADLNASNGAAWNRLRPKYYDSEILFDTKGLASVNFPANAIVAISMDVSP